MRFVAYICEIHPWKLLNGYCRAAQVLGKFNKCTGLRPWDTLSSGWLGWRRRTGMGKQFSKSLDLSFQNVTVSVLTIILYCIKGFYFGHAIRSGRGQRLGSICSEPADADFPRDICLTVWRNHKYFLLFYLPWLVVKEKCSLFACTLYIKLRIWYKEKTNLSTYFRSYVFINI